jgi:hypothetical protein
MKTRLIYVLLLLLVSFGWGRLSAIPSASAHEAIACICPPVPACPPEGYTLVEASNEEANQSLEAALEAIEKAEQALQAE